MTYSRWLRKLKRARRRRLRRKRRERWLRAQEGAARERRGIALPPLPAPALPAPALPAPALPAPTLPWVRTFVLLVLALALIGAGLADLLPHALEGEDVSAIAREVAALEDRSMWEALDEKGIRAAAWLELAGTSIDTPIMQGADDFYLTHDARGKESSNGIPYLHEESGPDDRVRIVLGHHIPHTTIAFSELSDVWRREVFKEIGELTWRTRSKGETIFRPFCAIRVPADYELLWKGLDEETSLTEWVLSLARDAQATRPEEARLDELELVAKRAKEVIVLVTCSETNARQPWRTLVVFTAT